MKKILYSLGTLAAVATPISAVVACGRHDTVHPVDLLGATSAESKALATALGTSLGLTGKTLQTTDMKNDGTETTMTMKVVPSRRKRAAVTVPTTYTTVVIVIVNATKKIKSVAKDGVIDTAVLAKVNTDVATTLEALVDKIKEVANPTPPANPTNPPAAGLEYHVQGVSDVFATEAEAKAKVDTLIQGQEVFVYNNQEYASETLAQDAAYAAAAKDTKAIDSGSKPAAGADGASDISGIAEAATKDGWVFGGKIYASNDDYKAAWLAANPNKGDAAEGQATATIAGPNSQTATVNLPNFAFGSTPTAAGILGDFAWSKTTTGTSTYVAAEKEVVTFTPASGVTIDKTTHTYAAAGPNGSTAIGALTPGTAGVEATTGTQQVIAIALQEEAAKTLDIDITSATMTAAAASVDFTSADSITKGTFTAGDATGPTAGSITFTIPGATASGSAGADIEVTITEKSGSEGTLSEPANEAAILSTLVNITTTTEGAAAITTPTASTATFTFDSETFTLTKASGAAIDASDVTAAVTTPGVTGVAQTGKDTYTLMYKTSTATSITQDQILSDAATGATSTAPTDIAVGAITVNVTTPAKDNTANTVNDAPVITPTKVKSTVNIPASTGVAFDQATMVPTTIATYHFLGTDQTKAFLTDAELKTYFKSLPANAIAATKSTTKFELISNTATKYASKAAAYKALIS